MVELFHTEKYGISCSKLGAQSFDGLGQACKVVHGNWMRRLDKGRRVQLTGSSRFLEVSVVQWKVCRHNDEFHIVRGRKCGCGAQQARVDGGFAERASDGDDFDGHGRCVVEDEDG
jgi:hypothetical protein